jgi:heat shock protein HtpX
MVGSDEPIGDRVMGVPDAFAVGGKGAGAVLVSEELVRIEHPDKLEGVLAHELTHIRTREVVMMVLSKGVASIVVIVARWTVLLR